MMHDSKQLTYPDHIFTEGNLRGEPMQKPCHRMTTRCIKRSWSWWEGWRDAKPAAPQVIVLYNNFMGKWQPVGESNPSFQVENLAS